MLPLEIIHPTLTRRRIWTARLLGLVVDAMQWVLLPFFVEGVASPAEDAVDIIVAFAMTSLVGWHWSFLPALAMELVPGVDLVPTWTAAVWLATRGRRLSPSLDTLGEDRGEGSERSTKSVIATVLPPST